MHAVIFPSSVFLSVDKKTDDFREFGRCAGVGFADNQQGTSQKNGKIKYASHWHGHCPRKRSFSRSHRENAGRASAGLVRPVLENRSNRAAETAGVSRTAETPLPAADATRKAAPLLDRAFLACFKSVF